MSLPPLLSTLDTYTQSALEFQQIKKEAHLASIITQHQATGLVASPPKDASGRGTHGGHGTNSLRSSSASAHNNNGQHRAAKPKSDMPDKFVTAGGGRNNAPRFRGNGSKHVEKSDSKDAEGGSGNDNSNPLETGDNSNNSNSNNHNSDFHLHSQKENRHTANRGHGRLSSSKEAKGAGSYLMGEEVHPSFAKAIEALAAIRLHAFSRKRKDLIQQKMDLLNEIRNYQKENFEDNVDNIQSQFQLMLAVWKIRFFIELIRFKQVKKRYLYEKKQSADREDKFKRELDAITVMVNERRNAYDDLRQNSAKQIDDLRGQTAQLSEREMAKDAEILSLKRKLGETESKLDQATNSLNRDHQKDVQTRNVIKELEDNCAKTSLELTLTRKTFEDVMLKNDALEKENLEAKKVFATVENLRKDFNHRLEMLNASFQSQQSILMQELESLHGINDNNKAIINELNQRNTLLEQTRMETNEAFESQSITNIDMASELTRVTDEKVSLQIVVTDLALKLQKCEQDNSDKLQAFEKIQTKYNLSRVQKAELKMIVQIMETEIHSLKDKLKAEDEAMTEQIRQNELSLMKVEDVEVGWSVTLNSLIKTAGYCRFLEDQLFSIRKIQGQTPSSSRSNTAGNVDNQLFNTWSDSTYNPNSSNGANGSRIAKMEAGGSRDSPNKQQQQQKDGQSSRPDSKRVSFHPDSDNNSSNINDNDNDNEGQSFSSNKAIQSLEDKLKIATQVTDSVLKMIESHDSPSKSNLVASYTAQKEQLLRVFGNVEKKLSRIKDELNDDHLTIKRSYETINNLLDRKTNLVHGIRGWWDKWLVTNLKVPTEIDFKWHLSVIGETIEGCDLNIYSILTSLFEIVPNLKQKSDLASDLEILYHATKLTLQNLNKGVSDNEVIAILQDFERLEIETSHLHALPADKETNMEPQKLLDKINTHLESSKMQPFALFWSCAIPAYICYVTNNFPIIKTDANETEGQTIITAEMAAEAKTREIYQINLKKTQDVEALLSDLKSHHDKNCNELSLLTATLFKEEEKMKDWVMQYMKICKREPVLIDKQHSPLFMTLHAKYESLKDNLLNLYDDTGIVQEDIIKYVHNHKSLKAFLQEHCRICFNPKDINDQITITCEPSMKYIMERLVFKSFHELGNDLTNNYLPLPAVSKELEESPTKKSSLKGANYKATSSAGHSHSNSKIANLIEKLVYDQADLSSDKFLARMREELSILKSHLEDLKGTRKVLRHRLNEASRLLNIWLESYKSTHNGKEPSEEVVHNLAKDIVVGFNTCSTELSNNMREITTTNSSIKERREVMNKILVVRTDLKDSSWFEEEELASESELASGSSMLQDLNVLVNREEGGALTGSLVSDHFPGENSLVSEISFSIGNAASESIANVKYALHPSHASSYVTDRLGISEKPVNEYEISSKGLESIDKEISSMKINLRDLKGEYERIKDLYTEIDTERSSSRSAMNEWTDSFRAKYSRVPTEIEKHAERNDLITSLQSCQDRLILCFNSMSELKAKFDTGQSRLALLKERRDKIFDSLNH